MVAGRGDYHIRKVYHSFVSRSVRCPSSSLPLCRSCTVGCSLVTGHVHDASSVSLHVQGQVVAAGERPRAEVALEGLGSSVLPVVPRQLV